MALSTLARTEAPATERRRHQRVRVAVLGRYMLTSRQEFPCQTVDMSPGGIALVAPVHGSVGERVICYIDQIGRVEGKVVRVFDCGFALALSVPVLKRDKLADQLTWLGNRHVLGMPEDRRHERATPRQQRSSLQLPDGRNCGVRIIDVSISGASFTCELQPAIGTLVTVGSTAAQIVRVFPGGAAVAFARPFSADTAPGSIEL